jgi:nitric oxide reductase NorD protein
MTYNPTEKETETAANGRFNHDTRVERLLDHGDESLVMDVYELAGELARVHPAPAGLLLDKAPRILDRVGYEGLRKIADISGTVAVKSWKMASDLVERCTYRMDAILEHGDRSMVLEVLELVRLVARDRWEFATPLLDKSREIIEALMDQGGSVLIRKVLGVAVEAAKEHGGIAGILVEKSPEIIRSIGFEGFQKVAGVAMGVSARNPDSALRFLEGSPRLLDRLLKCGGPGLIPHVLDLSARLAVENERVAVRLCEKSPDLIPGIGYEGLEKFARLCCDLEKSGWEIAASFMETSPEIIKRVGQEGLDEIAAMSAQVGRACSQTAAHLCKSSPEIMDRVTYDGFKDIAAFCLSLAEEGSGVSAGLIEKSPELIDRLLRRGDRFLVKRVYALAKETARKNPRIAISLLEWSPDILDRAGVDGLEAIAELSLRVARISWTAADSLLKISTQVMDRAGQDGLKKVADLSLALARQNVYGAVSFLERSPALTDGVLRYGDRSLLEEVYGTAIDIARDSWTMAVALLDKSTDLMERVGIEGMKRVADLASQVAQEDSRVAVSLIGVCPELLDRMGMEGLSIVSGYCGQLAHESWKGAVSFLKKSPTLIDGLLKHGERPLVMDVFRLALQIMESSSQVSVRVLEKSADYIELSGYEGLVFIARRAQEMAELNEPTAISFAKGESIEFADFVEGIPKGLLLKTIKPVLSGYLAALLGYRVEIEEGNAASTDGYKIYLPKRIREFQEDEKNFLYYKVTATHQEGHLEYGSFDFEMCEVEDLAERVGMRFGKKDAKGASEIERFYSLFPEPALARDLINILEDCRIQAKLGNEYPVLAEHIQFVNTHNLKKRPPLKRLKNDKQRSVEAVGRALIAGNRENDLSDQHARIVQTAIRAGESLNAPHTTVHDAVRMATDLYIRIHEAFKDPYRPLHPISKPIDQARVTLNIGSFGRTSRGIGEKLEGNRERRGDMPRTRGALDGDSSGEMRPAAERPNQEKVPGGKQRDSTGNRAFEGRDPGERYGAKDTGSEEPDPGDANRSMNPFSVGRIEKLLRELFKKKGITPKEIETKTQHMPRGQLELFLNHLSSLVQIDTELEREKGTFLYSEWDDDTHAYRENWSRIRERPLEGEPRSFYADTLEKHSGLLKKIRREFQMLRPEDLAIHKKQYEGDEVDLDAAVEYLINLKMGLPPSEKNYMRTEKSKRDIAAVFLIDMSKSTKGATIRCEKEALIIMSEALSEVGDAFAIFGFSGNNRDNVDYYKIKDFEERYSGSVKDRISAIDYGFENRDGAAIRHTVSILRKREEKTKLIVLLSDGKPVDKEYSGNYAIEDTRMALLEAKKLGIHTFCITVDTSAADYLPRMYSHSSWVVIDDVNRLPEKISRIYGKLTH